MGVWTSIFYDVQTARDFQALVSEGPVPASSEDPRLFSTVGDDGFHDLLADFSRDDPNMDVRGPAVAWVASWIADGQMTWTKGPWNEEALAIVQETVDTFKAHSPHVVSIPPAYHDYFREPQPKAWSPFPSSRF
jgi:hypothetical protein